MPAMLRSTRRISSSVSATASKASSSASLEPKSRSSQDARITFTGVVIEDPPDEEQLKTTRRPRHMPPLERDPSMPLSMRLEELQQQLLMKADELRQQKQQPQLSNQSTSKQQHHHPQAQHRRSHHEMAPQLSNHPDTLLVTPRVDPPLIDRLSNSESKLMRKKRHSKSRSKSSDSNHSNTLLVAPSREGQPMDSLNNSRSKLVRKERHSSERRSKSSDITTTFNARADSPMPMAPNMALDDHMPSLQVTNKPRSNSFHVHPYRTVASSRESNKNREGFCRSPHPVQGFATDPSAAKQQQQVKVKQSNKKKLSQYKALQQLESSKSFNKEKLMNNDPPEGGEEEDSTTDRSKFNANNLSSRSKSFNNEYHPENKLSNDPPEGGWGHMSTEALASSFSSSESTTSLKQHSSLNKSLGSLHMSSFNNKEHANSIDDDDSGLIKQSTNSDNSIAIIDADSSSLDATNTTEKLRTAEQLNDRIEMMQLEFQKLRSAKVNAKMKAQTLKTELVSMQQEQDAEFVSLSEEMEHWKRCAQEEKVRYESIQEKVERLEDENVRMKMEWSSRERLLSSVLEGKSSELEEKVEVLENENRRLRKRVVSMLLKDTSSHEAGSMASFLSEATPTKSKIGSPTIHHRYRTPGPQSRCTVFDTMAIAASPVAHFSSQPSLHLQACASQHTQEASQQRLQHPKSVHVRRRYNDYTKTSDLRPSSNDTVPQAPASWHGGGSGKCKKSVRRLPVIVPHLITSGGMIKKNNTSTTTNSAQPASPSKIHSRRSHLQRKSSSYSISTAVTSTTARSSATTLRDSSLSASMSSKEDEEFGSPLQSLDGLVVLMDDHNMREDGNDGTAEDNGIDESMRSAPF